MLLCMFVRSFVEFSSDIEKPAHRELTTFPCVAHQVCEACADFEWSSRADRPLTRCNKTCDNCEKGEKFTDVDVTEEARSLIRIVQNIGESPPKP